MIELISFVVTRMLSRIHVAILALVKSHMMRRRIRSQWGITFYFFLLATSARTLVFFLVLSLTVTQTDFTADAIVCGTVREERVSDVEKKPRRLRSTWVGWWRVKGGTRKSDKWKQGGIEMSRFSCLFVLPLSGLIGFWMFGATRIFAFSRLGAVLEKAVKLPHWSSMCMASILSITCL